MTAPARPVTGGCQCGAVRFAAASLGRASICHCRMCQKAFGGFFGPLAAARDLVWTRGEPARFRSSNKVRRGFCAACGTPLTYEPDGSPVVDVALGALDDPAAAAPTVQLAIEARLPFFAALAGLPEERTGDDPRDAAFQASLISCQHPDRDTADWPPPATETQP
jgi:hypothetical protein